MIEQPVPYDKKTGDPDTGEGACTVETLRSSPPRLSIAHLDRGDGSVQIHWKIPEHRDERSVSITGGLEKIVRDQNHRSQVMRTVWYRTSHKAML